MLKLSILVAVVIAAVAATSLLALNRPRLVAVDAAPPEDFPAGGFSHRLFERLLRTFVDEAGRVDYGAWHASAAARAQLDAYLAAVIRYSPENRAERFPARGDALAYWMYAYNAYVIKSVLDRWPLQSVTDVKAPVELVKGFGFFYRQRFLFGGKAYSLYAVENEKIRATFKDARIHFVLNCGSESCPILRCELPDGEALEPLLQRAATDFVADPRNVSIDHGKRQIVLSAIFKWYKKDFINDLKRRGLPSGRGLAGYVASVASDQMRAELMRAADYAVVFAAYDWSVNQSD